MQLALRRERTRGQVYVDSLKKTPTIEQIGGHFMGEMLLKVLGNQVVKQLSGKARYGPMGTQESWGPDIE